MAVTSLEMTSACQLVPGRPPPAPLELAEVGPAMASVLRSSYVRTWGQLASGGRMSWSDGQWAEELSQPGIHAWIAQVRGEVAGFVELEACPNGDVGIVVFGLVPEFIGSGYGGAFLTIATEMAWQLGSTTGRPTERVWLQTSSDDHPHALVNYQRRGFRIFEPGSRH